MYQNEEDQDQDDADSIEDTNLSSKESKIINFSWTKEATRMLIGLRIQLDSEFDDPVQKKMDLWEKISITLNDHGFDFPPSICDKKWRNLLVSFRRTVNRGTGGKIGRFPYTWEFYDDLYNYWQKKDPNALKNLSNPPQNESTNGENDDEFDDELAYDSSDELNNDSNVDDVTDLNKYLSVTLAESEPQHLAHKSINSPPKSINYSTKSINSPPKSINNKTMPNISSQQYIPNEIEIRRLSHMSSFNNNTTQRNSLEISPVVSYTNYNDSINEDYECLLNKNNNGNWNKAKEYLRPMPSITIEEVRPVGGGQKRKNESYGANNHGEIQNNKELNSGLNCPIPSKIIKKNGHFDGSNDEIEPPLWFLYQIEKIEQNNQRRWEESEERQWRRWREEREINLEILKSINSLTTQISILAQKHNENPQDQNINENNTNEDASK